MGKEHAVHGLSRQRLYMGVQTDHGLKEWMAASVDMHFDWLGIQSREHSLEVAKNVAGDLSCPVVAEQIDAVFFAHRNVASQYGELW